MLDKIKAENPKLVIFCSECCSYIDKDENDFKQWLENNYRYVDQVSEYKIYSPK